MVKVSSILVGLFIGIFVTDNSYGQDISEWVELGKPASINCPVEGNGSVYMCHILRLDVDGKENMNFTITPGTLLTHHENYVGNAFDECGIVIRKVTRSDLTVWDCIAGLKESYSVLHSRIQLIKAVRPKPPKIVDNGKRELINLIDESATTKDGKKHIGQNIITLRCCSEEGEPRPELSFYLGERKIYRAIEDDNYGPPTYCLKWENAKFTREDDGKMVKCGQKHVALKREEFDVQTINIFYPPQLVDEHMFSVDKFFVSANPRPEVEAIFLEENVTFSEMVDFNVTVSTAHVNAWNITSYINMSALPADCTIEIRASNPYGNLEVIIPTNYLNPKSQPPVIVENIIPPPPHQNTIHESVKLETSEQSSNSNSTITLITFGVLGLILCLLWIVIISYGKWTGIPVSVLLRNWRDDLRHRLIRTPTIRIRPSSLSF